MSHIVPQFGQLQASLLAALTTILVSTPVTPLLAQLPKQNQASQPSETAAKETMDVLNQAQQTYFSELQKFAMNIVEMGLDIDAQTQDYSYQIVPQQDPHQSVMMTATAKRSGLRSYTGAVFVLESDEERLTLAGICETNKPSSTPPTMPMFPKALSESVQCPPGSSLVE